VSAPINPVSDPWHPSTEIVDVRSPSEFAEDHLPGAVNLPVLSDAERAEVGTRYAQDAFAARKLGAALVANNIAGHLREHFAGLGRDYRPLVYCWRGGQRSESLATVLAAIGWPVAVLTGGYKTYRHAVQAQLLTLPHQFKFQVLCGPTGSGKTRLLKALAAVGAQVLDLEGLANHRGSLLGSQGQQPSQKWFESQLLATLRRFDPQRVVWVEAESAKVGQIHVPKALLSGMAQGFRVQLAVPLATRTQWILQEYPHFVEDPEDLKGQLKLLTGLCGHARIRRWYDLIERQEWGLFVLDILQHHYDPTYHHSASRHPAQRVIEVQAWEQAVPELLALTPTPLPRWERGKTPGPEEV